MIDKQKTLHTARIARLELSDSEVDAYTAQLGSILSYVALLDTAGTAGVEPTCYTAPSHDPLRDDAEQPSLEPGVTLRNGPVVKKGHFAVPKIINQAGS
ncbi:MAG: Asp-tRNA(Asn)/Glu-tRNA(Gln) amidotransferase subunit GatC [Chitinispirillales bacterium]|jgi:aspartyl-tRNA(Asn)/glutamyl-tRNA(Gln) amidotransferase subunit C|nr:Asp-tRNA(Asn)/Glu-tRNA(Gln) amidotransferase subunit GatC [Chitinispirillales bacterium]